MAKLLTTAEVAERLRISRRLVLLMIERKELAAARIGKRLWVVSEVVVDAYVAAHTTTSAGVQ